MADEMSSAYRANGLLTFKFGVPHASIHAFLTLFWWNTCPRAADARGLMPHLSVLIPTFQRPARIAACLASLRAQVLEGLEVEIVVGLDGPDPRSREAIERVWPRASTAGAMSLEVLDFPKQGYMGVRREILARATGQVMVSLNDDVEVCPGFLAAHARRHLSAPGPAIVVGDSPWKVHPGDTLFDRMVRETSLIFFYDQMYAKAAAVGPDHDWGYRFCYGLNFSARLDLVREVGGFADHAETYGYDDIELGFRLARAFKTPVLFEPGAAALHDHRYTPRDVIRREYNLGRAAWKFARSNRDFGLDLFGRDITSEGELAYSREFVSRERKSAMGLAPEFLALGERPSGLVAPSGVSSGAAGVVRALAQQFMLLKRWLWRRGLLDESEGLPAREVLIEGEDQAGHVGAIWSLRSER